jgi:[FeFe] hydrogenase H-cluster maturation GTPase HydF
MEKAPKALRLHIGIFGRTNVGKSSFLNWIAGQDVAITSPLPGTTTDAVEKTMELLPLGPVVFLDTAGIDDVSDLAELRIRKTQGIFERSDIVLLVTEPNRWTAFEERICEEAKRRRSPFILIVNKIDLEEPSDGFLQKLGACQGRVLLVSSRDFKGRDEGLKQLKEELIRLAPEDYFSPPAIIGDLIPPGGLAVLIIPIDFEAPKGRIILPQVQAIRDALDHGQGTLIVRESEYLGMLERLSKPPDLVVCDSQVVDRMAAETPRGVKCTTFSILFSRLKGDLNELVRGVRAIDGLRTGDKVLIAEACSHHAIEGDIGRIKIPQWIRDATRSEPVFEVSSGRDTSGPLEPYKLIIHCGSCMLTRRETLQRILRAREAGVPITNYGLAISYVQGVLERVLEPFPEALRIFREEVKPKALPAAK